MKNTEKFLSKYFNSSEKSFYQMMKYHNFIFFTQQNVNPMFFGESMFNSNGTSILKYIKKKGFITGHSNNICTRQLYDIEDNYTENIEYDNFDHENIAMMCDPNFYNPENRFTPYMGPYSIRRRCLYGRDAFEYVIEYGTKFWEAYPNNKKFLRLAFIDPHERSEEVVKYMDEPLTQFLENLMKRKLLENTAIFFVSDHGNGMHGYYRWIQADDFLFERVLAFWFMILHNYKDEEGINNLKENSQTFLTPYDIFDTLSDIVFDEVNMDVHTRNDLGYSVFRKIDAKSRTCMRYTEWPLDEMCHCRIPGQNYSTPIGLENMKQIKKDL